MCVCVCELKYILGIKNFFLKGTDISRFLNIFKWKKHLKRWEVFLPFKKMCLYS